MYCDYIVEKLAYTRVIFFPYLSAGHCSGCVDIELYINFQSLDSSNTSDRR